MKVWPSSIRRGCGRPPAITSPRPGPRGFRPARGPDPRATLSSAWASRSRTAPAAPTTCSAILRRRWPRWPCLDAQLRGKPSGIILSAAEQEPLAAGRRAPRSALPPAILAGWVVDTARPWARSPQRPGRRRRAARARGQHTSPCRPAEDPRDLEVLDEETGCPACFVVANQFDGRSSAGSSTRNWPPHPSGTRAQQRPRQDGRGQRVPVMRLAEPDPFGWTSRTRPGLWNHHRTPSATASRVPALRPQICDAGAPRMPEAREVYLPKASTIGTWAASHWRCVRPERCLESPCRWPRNYSTAIADGRCDRSEPQQTLERSGRGAARVAARQAEGAAWVSRNIAAATITWQHFLALPGDDARAPCRAASGRRPLPPRGEAGFPVTRPGGEPGPAAGDGAKRSARAASAPAGRRAPAGAAPAGLGLDWRGCLAARRVEPLPGFFLRAGGGPPGLPDCRCSSTGRGAQRGGESILTARSRGGVPAAAAGAPSARPERMPAARLA
jgi:hypothetical protein